MLQNIVTVTYEEDFKYLLLQAESIQKHLISEVPFTHWVIINDPTITNIVPYRLQLEKYYNNTTCKLKIFQQPFFKNKFISKSLDGSRNVCEIEGTYSQQICKLEIAKYIKDDYLVLDSKNFFIKPVSLQYWENKIGSGEYVKTDTNYFWKNCIIEYCNKFSIDVPDYVCNPVTPFKIKINEDMLNTDFKPLLENSHVYSEFILYWLKYIKGVDPVLNKEHICFSTFFPLNSMGIVHPTEFLAYKIPTIDNNPNIYVSGFHREFIKLCKSEHINFINEWLEQKEIEFRF